MRSVQSRWMRTVISRLRRRLGMACLLGVAAALAAPAIGMAAGAPKRPNWS